MQNRFHTQEQLRAYGDALDAYIKWTRADENYVLKLRQQANELALVIFEELDELEEQGE